jgi:hypothetical protein
VLLDALDTALARGERQLGPAPVRVEEPFDAAVEEAQLRADPRGRSG